MQKQLSNNVCKSVDEKSAASSSGVVGDRRRETCRSSKELNSINSVFCFTNPICTLVTKP